MRSIFEQIKDRLPITDVLSSYITLIPSGSQYKAKCPFHNERTASFSISPDRGLYYCFGCGAKGDIFSFVEQFEGVDTNGALKILAERAGVPLERTFEKKENTDALYELLEMTTIRYHAELARHPEVLEYLTTRGISAESIAAFRIGYVPDEWRFVTSTLQSTKDIALAERAGLIKEVPKPKTGYYDRFRGRIMFPLTEASGRVVGFSGRRFPEGTDNSSPKYLNSPETEIFQKSRILFGFDKAKSAIRQHNFAVLVEGQVDCVLAHQAGFRNTVATSGTAISDAAAADPTANLRVLARLTSHLFLAFDGDAAGQKALTHAALVALTLGMNPKVVPLPPGVDPAEYIAEKGGAGWKELLKASEHFIMHQTHSIDAQTLSAHALGAEVRQKLFPFLARVTSPVEQGKYLESIARELELSRDDLAQELSQFRAAQPDHTSLPVSYTEEETTETVSDEERFLALVAQYPSDTNAAKKDALEKLVFAEHIFTFPVVDDRRMDELRLFIEREYDSLGDDERSLLIEEIAHKLENKFYTTLRDQYARRLKTLESTGDEAAVQACLKTLQVLNQHRHDAT